MDGRTFTHREISYTPTDLRKRKQHLYIVTDMPDIVNVEFAAETDGILQDLNSLTDETVANSAFYVNFSTADLAVPVIRRIIKNKGLFAPPPEFSKKTYEAFSKTARNTLNEVLAIQQHNFFGYTECSMQLSQAVELTKNLEGDFVELGVYSGTSALEVMIHMRNLGLKRTCYLLDTYNGFNYIASEKSSDLIWDRTHLQNPLATMERIKDITAVTQQDVRIEPCEICSQSLPLSITKIALAHVDVDMYESTLESLSKLAKFVVHKGIIVLDDTPAVPGLYGAYVAMLDFLDSDIGSKFMGIHTTTKHFLIKVDH